jgi:hypothetical protein
LGAVLALGLAAALGCALCGFLDVLFGLAVGMGPPVIGKIVLNIDQLPVNKNAPWRLRKAQAR